VGIETLSVDYKVDNGPKAVQLSRSANEALENTAALHGENDLGFWRIINAGFGFQYWQRGQRVLLIQYISKAVRSWS
jgi:hypothetical protein